MLDLLRDQPALVVFLVIGSGYLLDRVRIGGVQIGVTTGVNAETAKSRLRYAVARLKQALGSAAPD